MVPGDGFARLDAAGVWDGDEQGNCERRSGEDVRECRTRKTEGHVEGLPLWGLDAISPAASGAMVMGGFDGYGWCGDDDV
ncbi:hypothetical protein SESBI_02942 [Sesbania bispinosa]|nr:hypothetical protein SESBI_02942 [Sesbania bispinosa]